MSSASAFNLLRLLAMCCVLLSAHAQEETEVTTELPGNATTEEIITEFSLEAFHINSTYNSICVAWRSKVPADITVKNYKVYSHLRGSESYIMSPLLPGSAKVYTEHDLIRDEEFVVCVEAIIVNGSFLHSVESKTSRVCIDAYTIPYMRPDSVYVLFIMVMTLVGLLVAAIWMWRRDLNRFRAAQDKKSLVSVESRSDDEDSLSNGSNLFPDERAGIPNRSSTKPLMEEEEVPFMSKEKPENGITFSVN
jgi:hypothetical protein